MVEKKGGLLPQHHGDLNRPVEVYLGGEEAQNARIAELRTIYADDPRALQQIDVYDGSTEYHDKISQYVEALKSGDAAKENELDAWFLEHYPLL